jgi:hypothetical protein
MLNDRRGRPSATMQFAHETLVVVASLLVFAVLANVKFLLDLPVAFHRMLLGVAWLP